MEDNFIVAPSSPKQEMMLNQSADVAILGGAMGCLPHDAEFLTESGWKPISEYVEGDKVLQYTPSTDVAEFVYPNGYLKEPHRNFKRLKARGLDLIHTPEHMVLYYNEGCTTPKVTSFAEVIRRHTDSEGWTGRIKTTFNVSTKGISLTEDDIRIHVLGSHLLSDTRFHNRWWNCSQEQLSWIVDEVKHWDSIYVENQKHTTIRYSTSIKENADFIQYAFHTQGYNTSINVRRNDSEYTVQATLTGKGFRGFANKDGKAPVEDYPSEGGYKYCFSVPSGFFVVRQNNKVFITGNSGKSYVLLMYPLKFCDDPYFRGIIFRKTTGEIRAQGGLWENACEMYISLFGEKNLRIQEKELKITFPSGGSIKFSYLERTSDLLRHQGAAYTFCGFDEGTHFSRAEVEYLIKRIRSARAKHKKQLVITCNPDPDWELLDWIRPYLQEDGTPNLEMDGVLRYYAVENGNYIWADTKEELERRFGSGTDSGIKSFTFISATCEDNVPLLKADPSYLSNLKAQPWVDVQRYLYGNWYVRPTGSTFFNRSWMEEVDFIDESEVVRTVRTWDFAGTLPSDTNPSPDYTASVRMRLMKDGTYIIDDIMRCRVRSGDWLDLVLSCAEIDPPNTTIYIPEDPNPSAKRATQLFIRDLAELGFYAKKIKTNQSKLDRFRPFSAVAQNEGVKILSNCGDDRDNNKYNELDFYYKELEAFTGKRKRGELGHDDLVDATSDAFYVLASSKQFSAGDINAGLSSMASAMTVPTASIFRR